MEGLNKFREAFAEYSENYVVIGGTACEIVMKDTVVRPRATHDIDMIVIVEKMTASFAERFWQFVREAGYHPHKKKQEEGIPAKYELYRFVGGKEGYPVMIELLSRHSDVFGEPEGLTVEPIVMPGDNSSLSAILMDDDFYQFAILHSRVTEGIRHADSLALIALKAKAYLNLLADREKGKQVNSHDIKKHRSDVLKNAFITAATQVEVPASILGCVKEFVSLIRSEWETLETPLSMSLERDEEEVGDLLDQLEELFVLEQ